MSTREEIRDVDGGIGDVLRQMNIEVMLESGRNYGYYIEKILRYLDSQGVVIKVKDRKLPKEIDRFKGQVKRVLTQAGYEAVESLVEEVHNAEGK